MKYCDHQSSVLCPINIFQFLPLKYMCTKCRKEINAQAEHPWVQLKDSNRFYFFILIPPLITHLIFWRFAKNLYFFTIIYICLPFALNFSFQKHSADQGKLKQNQKTLFSRQIQGYFRLFTFHCTKEIREKILLSSWHHNTSLLENNGLDSKTE